VRAPSIAERDQPSAPADAHVVFVARGAAGGAAEDGERDPTAARRPRPGGEGTGAGGVLAGAARAVTYRGMSPP
jgi:hypothetical protein